MKYREERRRGLVFLSLHHGDDVLDCVQQALRELRRGLRPGGRLGVAVRSTADTASGVAVVGRRLAPRVPPGAPERRLPAPTALGAPGLRAGRAAAAGSRGVIVRRRTPDSVARRKDAVGRFRVEHGPPAARAAVAALTPAPRERLRAAVDSALAPDVRDGAVRLPSAAVSVAATA